MNVSHSQPRFAVPKHACDCHMHIFGPAERYPYWSTRSYTPREASLRDYDAMASVLGLERMVLVQASAYGADNRCMLDAMRAAGPRARGVVAIDRDTSVEELRRMHALGVRGVRINMVSTGLTDPETLAALFADTAKRVGPLGWHIQLFITLDLLRVMALPLKTASVPFVIDHMGLAKGALGPEQPGFPELLDLLASGRCWVKLSGAYRVSTQEPHFRDAATIARPLISTNKRKLVWGTDWPHTGKHAGKALHDAPLIEYRKIDDGRLLDLLAEWAPDPQVRELILVRNPAELYEF